MKTDTHTIEVQGDLGGEKIAMSFDANSLAHIMSVLTDLYSDPEMAIIREYSTNAKDSHVAAGINRPIEITPPSGLNPQFKIQDFGLGLSKQDIANIYSKYGASTKRNTNDQVGMLGLGCKSALTYSNQFTLIGIKNGIETSVVISRTSDGSGTMEVVSEKLTNEHNGVTVIIPARGTPKFLNKIEDFFSYWDKNDVLISGKPPKEIKTIEITNKLFFELNNQNSDVIVMGGVAYPIDDDIGKQVHKWYKRSRFIYYAEIGEVNFTPSREKLHYTAKTKSTIDNIEFLIRSNFDKALSNYLNNSKNHLEFAIEALRLKNILQISSLTYKGESIPVLLGSGQIFNVSSSKNRFSKSSDIYVNNYRIWDEDPTTLFVLGLDYNHDLTTNEKSKTRRYIEKEHSGMHYVLFLENKPASGWFDHVKTIQWGDIKEAKFPKEKRIKVDRRYHVVGQYGRFNQYKEFDSTKKLVYYTGSSFNEDERGQLWRYFVDCQIVSISSNQENNFKKDFPHAKSIQQFVKDEIEEYKKNLSDADKLILMLSNKSNDLTLLKRFDANKIDDPKIVEVAKDKNKLNDRNIIDANNTFLRRWHSAKIYENEKVLYEIENPLQRYPLINSYDFRGKLDLEHIYTYINAIYNKFYKGN